MYAETLRNESAPSVAPLVRISPVTFALPFDVERIRPAKMLKRDDFPAPAEKQTRLTFSEHTQKLLPVVKEAT